MKKEERKRIARERVKRLFRLAEEASRQGKQERADRYAELIWRICLRHNLRPRERRRICRRCHCWLQPGKTLRIRTRADKQVVVWQCMRCGFIRRYPYRKVKK
ncbi:MAG: RNAase P [Candidatus Aenigmatarchaeota archaeon]|nr:MAG: RNAase P [Candidatus Aenigmarchaeota archaeon]